MTSSEQPSPNFEPGIFSKKRGWRVLICIRGNCASPNEGQALEMQLLQLIKRHGLDDPEHPHHVTCRTVQCLGVCHSGPIMMVHPGAVRYQQVDEAALGRIVQEHFIDGNPVEDLRLLL